MTACADSTIRVFDTTSGLMKVSLQGHNGSVDHLEFDGETIVSVGCDRCVEITLVLFCQG